jgi:hypothetical protein
MHSGRGVSETRSGRWRPDARGEGVPSDDPFALLGLPTRAGLSDDDVRAAWRRIAAATHPDREDGGDPARFGAAAAAYVALRTGFGRGETLADLGLGLGLGLGGAGDHGGRHARRPRRAADPAAALAGRHRARHGASADGRPGARSAGMRRLRGWIMWRAPSAGLADAATQGPAEAAAPASGEAATHMSGEAGGHAPWEATTYGLAGGAAARVSGESITDGSAGEAAGHAPAGWHWNWRSTGSRLRSRPIRRPGGLAVRAACAAVVGVVAIVVSGWSPGVVGVLAGVLTWLLAAAGRAFARRRSH